MNENIQNMIDQMGDEVEEQIMRRREEEMRRIAALSPQEIIEYMEEQLGNTDVIFDGFNLTNSVDSATAIVLAGLMRIRSAAEGVNHWIQQKFPDAEEDDERADNETLLALAKLDLDSDDDDGEEEI